MNNEWLVELSQNPIVSTFRLAYRMLLSNKALFIWVVAILLWFAAAEFFIPFISGILSGQIL